MATPMMNILQGDPLDTEEQPPPTTAREVVARVPTLGVVGGPPAAPARAPEPVAAPQEAQVAAVAPTPAPGREMAQQGAQVAPAPPKFKLPPVDEMVNDYQRWTMMAADPDVARELAPRLTAWKNLTMQQHAAAFDGDPLESPEKAAAYARHMGQISGRLGQPMKWEEAANIAEYTEGRKAKMPTRFLQGMNSYDQTLVKPLVDDVFGADWEMVSLAPSKTRVGDSEMDVPTLTIRNARTGEVRPVSVFDAEAAFGNLEGRLKITKLNRERDLQAAQADLDLARANKDPAAAAAAFERITELKGGMGSIGPGRAAGAGALRHAPTVAAALQETQSPLDPEFVLAVIEHESGGKATAKSPKDAQGVMQLIPATAQRFGVKDAYNPEDNIRGGVKYLNWLYNRFNGDLKKVAAGYNAGEGAVDKYGGVPPYKETQGYVKNVLGTYQKHKGQTAESPTGVGERLVAMPIGSTAESLARGTPSLVTEMAKAKAAYVKAEEAIRKDALGEKEEARRLAELKASYRRQYPNMNVDGEDMTTAAANPPGMPVQPPGAAGKPKAAAQAAPPGKARTPEEIEAWINANIG